MKQAVTLIFLLLTITMLLTICSCANGIEGINDNESSQTQLEDIDNS